MTLSLTSVLAAQALALMQLVANGTAAQKPAVSAATDDAPYVASHGGAGRFALVAGKAAPLLVSAKDYPGVTRAARDLRADVLRVSNVEPAFHVDSARASREIVVIGTLGRSAVIDRLVREQKLNVAGIAGRWETFVIQIVEKPMPGVDRALVIAGSDKRGTIFGIYDLSAEIGVSPWTWWADVPARQQDSLFVLPGRHTRGEPAVKYRGIFLNDEAPALSGWTKEKFGGVNHQFYEKVFELVLRLKGNYLWPAMWGNAFNDDDSLNAKLADEYGVVMGTSHHEPMLRAQQEWKRYGKGEWNYEHNDSTLRAFWTQGIRNMGSHESIVTVGMRGDGDMPMSAGSNVALLERIVADQRKIIGQVTGKDPSATPQLWALYKEVQDYYDKGMRVPDDVTLLFSDDNWGNVRRLPLGTDTLRSGGFGIYYHFDYVGGPRNYKWLNTNPIARVWEQMHLSYRYGAKRIWIVNVGDLKPMELPISFFLDYAWNPARWPAERLPEYTRRWAEQQFGPEHASEIADVVTADLKFAARRKPELLDTATYSLTNYREAESVVAAYDSLRIRASAIGKSLAPRHQNAFYQLVLHPVLATANLNDLYVTVAKNRLYASQGRAATNDLADRARTLFDRDAEISHYYNTQLSDGKWDHLMDQTHIGYTYWQEPPRNVMPRVDVIQLPRAADMGVAVVEQNRPAAPRGGGRGGPIPGGAPPGFFGRGDIALPVFDPYQQQTYHFDVYNKGQTAFAYTVESSEPWVNVAPARGTVVKEERIAVSVDWKRAPFGDHKVPIIVTGPNGAHITAQAAVSNPASPKRDSIVGFVEGGGYVSMEAEHYTRAVSLGVINWQRIPDLGRTVSGVTPSPVTAPSQTPGGVSPHLEYRVFLFDSGAVTVKAYLSPTLNFSGSKDGLRYAVSFDDQPPVIINAQADTTTRAWEKIVADNIALSSSTHTVPQSGEHVLKFWMVDPGVVLQKIVIETRDIAPSYLGPPESFHRAGTPR
ncbi:MAG: glycosyl hydrolase 115 family protein [bacterium]